MNGPRDHHTGYFFSETFLYSLWQRVTSPHPWSEEGKKEVTDKSEEGRESGIQKGEWWSLFFSLQLEAGSFAWIDVCGSDLGSVRLEKSKSAPVGKGIGTDEGEAKQNNKRTKPIAATKNLQRLLESSGNGIFVMTGYYSA